MNIVYFYYLFQSILLPLLTCINDLKIKLVCFSVNSPNVKNNKLKFISGIDVKISFSIYAYISISNTEKFEQPLISDSKYISLELLEGGTTSNGEKYEIIRDTKTNILYLKYDKGITPILDNDGKPKRLYDIQVDIIDSEGNVESTIEHK